MTNNQPAQPQDILRVLLIDDQPLVAEAVRQMLADCPDLELHYEQDPARAIEAANTLAPAVILQDLVMPEVDGMMLVRFYRANPATSEVPLIVLSSKEEATTKAAAFAGGANDYLVKLPDKIELVARIRHHARGYISLLQRNEAYRKLDEANRIIAAELREAEEYVRNLLPAPLTAGPVITDWRFIPCSGLGGDAFGYHHINPDNMAFYLLDVCGHGVGAALLSISVMNVLRSGSLPEADFTRPAQVLFALNNAFPMEKQGDKFFSIWYGVYNIPSRTLCFASGGHPPAVLQEPGEQPHELKVPGMCIGYMPGMKFEEKCLNLAKGSRLHIFSDGIFELFGQGQELWPYRDFLATLRDHPELEGVIGAAREFQGREEFEDDYSLLRLIFN